MHANTNTVLSVTVTICFLLSRHVMGLQTVRKRDKQTRQTVLYCLESCLGRVLHDARTIFIQYKLTFWLNFRETFL